jgi:hypothetical protein
MVSRMSLRARARWTRLAAALLTAFALVPALHAASSHQAILDGDGPAVTAEACDARLAQELCPICLAGHTAAAVLAAPASASAPILAALPRLPAAPLLPARHVSGAAGPRAPPSA